MRIFVLFNLRPSVDPTAYEHRARTWDIVGVRTLASAEDLPVFADNAIFVTAEAL